ncbi:TonB-dependent receptor plug domain-containing protein [Colwellia psychrerythraea]|uniref:TonB-dependent receptor n=1 Tax=Colwellia psychrerythraea TaxID=28229 RepID=A0A099KWN3_COLPS|nr:TonB-dependent receptor [Colwellia psychrerythraea]KGJ94063.1 TonB-dependent receptor [Colwellia psychrerythraea]
MKKRFNYSTLALSVCLSLGSTATFAAEKDTSAGAEHADIERIVSVGTRISNRTVADSPSPIDIISSEAIKNSGATSTPDMLRKLAPSFNMNNTTTSDGQDLMRPATLRSLGPDQVLVLINGKRRHQQAVVAVQENVGRGSAGTDLSSIPMTAISHIEILRDGAAAQYGSDAIAGVINLVLKDDLGGSVWAQYGQTSEGDGESTEFGGNYGFNIGEKGTLNLTFEYADNEEMNRATPTTWFDAIDEPRQLLLVGEAATEMSSLWANFSYDIGESSELYAFGGFTSKEGESLGFYRPADDNRVWSSLYPEGVTPKLGSKSEDYSVAVGFKTQVADWDLDASVVTGENRFEFSNLESLNASYGPDSPTSAYDGALIYSQTTFNLDAVTAVDLGFYDETSIAFGAEFRVDGFAQEAGDMVTYARGDTLCAESVNPTGDPAMTACTGGDITTPGMQGFQGYSPEMAIDTDRNSFALYFDTETAITEDWLVAAAVRYEDYDDFGSTVIGKLSTHLSLTDNLAIRASASTGYRAPGMQQANFTQRSISLDNGELADLVTLRPNEALAEELGFTDLKEENSTNFSVGVVYTNGNYSSTLDVYQIDIDDRIVYSGNISRGINTDIDAFFDRHSGPGESLDGVKNVSIFTNAIDSETFGLDWVNQYTQELSSMDVVYELSYHHNNTEVSAINTSSSIVPNEVVFDNAQRLLVEKAQPQDRASLSAMFDMDSWSVTGRMTYYGEVTSASYGTPENTWGAKSLFDLTAQWQVTDNVNISGGVLNLTDEYPDEWGANGSPFTDLGFKYGWTSFPFSLAGREYYVRASYNF